MWKSSSGQYLLKPIFFEFSSPDSREAVKYTLKDDDHEFDGIVYPSLRKLYVASRDLTEYEFAKTHLGGWPHWTRLRECNWFKDYYRDWREELEVSLAATALKNIYLKAVDPDDKDSLSAAKFLVSGGWKPKDKQVTGPRTKHQIRQKAEELFKNSKDTDEDYSRLGIKSVN